MNSTQGATTAAAGPETSSPRTARLVLLAVLLAAASFGLCYLIGHAVGGDDTSTSRPAAQPAGQASTHAAKPGAHPDASFPAAPALPGLHKPAAAPVKASTPAPQADQSPDTATPQAQPQQPQAIPTPTPTPAPAPAPTHTAPKHSAPKPNDFVDSG